MRNRMKNVGILSAFCVVVLSVGVLSGCNPGGDSGGGVLLAAEVDNDSGFTDATIIAVEDKTTLIESATVTVNGTTVPFFLFANAATIPTVNPGDPVTLHFVYKDADVQSTLNMPGEPTGAINMTTAVASPITINWTAPATNAPAGYTVTIPSSDTVSGEVFSASVTGVTSYTIPAHTLLTGPISVTVEAVNQTTSLGSSVAAGSVYVVGNKAILLAFTGN